MGNRVDVEGTMGDYSASFNTLVKSHSANNEKITWLKDKIADLEDRPRRNNIKIRGISESVSPQKLQQFVQSLFPSLAPS